MLKIENITKSYRKKIVLENCSFELKAYQIWGILGLNGCGKSSLFKSIMGLTSVDKGNLYYQNQHLNFELRRRIGYMPEQRSLMIDLTVYDQLKLIAQLRKIENEFEERLHELMVCFKCQELKDRRISTLSKGQQQKVQLMMAVLHNPEILILDEPLNGLDYGSVQLFLEILKRYASQGKAILISSHQMDFMDELCTHVLILKAGKTLYQGAIHDLVKERGVCISVNSDAAWHGKSKCHESMEESRLGITFRYRNMKDARKAIMAFNQESTVTDLRLHQLSLGDIFNEEFKLS